MPLWMDPDEVEYDGEPMYHRILDHGLGRRADRTSEVPMRIAVVVVVILIGGVAGVGFFPTISVGTPGARCARARVSHRLVRGNPNKANKNYQPQQSHEYNISQFPHLVNSVVEVEYTIFPTTCRTNWRA